METTAAKRVSLILNRIVATVAIVCVALSQGCASFVPAHSDVPLDNQVEVGDQVRILAVGAEKRQFTVTKIDKNGLYDNEDYFRFDDIREIEIRKTSAEDSPSTLKVWGIVLGAILVLDALGVGDAD